jgi:Leucine-rich repeat (LRR) protein
VQVACGLSQLGLSASGTQQVFQKLEVTQTDLDNPQAVVHCQHIQNLVLSSNCLTTLQPLTQLKHLTNLDVSHNQLTEVSLLSLPVLISPQACTGGGNMQHALLCCPPRHPASAAAAQHLQHSKLASCAKPRLALHSVTFIVSGMIAVQVLYHQASPLFSKPDSSSHRAAQVRSSNLRKADLSYNAISSIRDLSQHSNLRELNLAGNSLKRIDRGLEALMRLRRLDLSSNCISSCQGLAGELRRPHCKFAIASCQHTLSPASLCGTITLCVGQQVHAAGKQLALLELLC